MKKTLLLFVLSFIAQQFSAQVYFYEPFDFFADVSSEEDYDWNIVNVSSPLGTESADAWYQADMSMGISAAGGFQEDCYVQADKYSTSATSGGTISNWLISPSVMLSDGDSIRFHAIAYDGARPDKIEVRISILGSETVKPISATDVGSFNIMIGAINPDLTPTGFNTVSNGDTWQLYRFLVAGIGSGHFCKIGIRYFVTNAGSQGSNGSAVAIDELYVVGPDGYIGVSEMSSPRKISAYPNPVNSNISLSEYSEKFELFDAAGRIVLTHENVPAHTSVDVSSVPSGVYILRLTTAEGLNVSQRLLKQ